MKLIGLLSSHAISQVILENNAKHTVTIGCSLKQKVSVWGGGGGKYLDHKGQVENRIVSESNLNAFSICMQNEFQFKREF